MRRTAGRYALFVGPIAVAGVCMFAGVLRLVASGAAVMGIVIAACAALLLAGSFLPACLFAEAPGYSFVIAFWGGMAFRGCVYAGAAVATVALAGAQAGILLVGLVVLSFILLAADMLFARFFL